MKLPRSANPKTQPVLDVLINHYVCLETERLDILQQKPEDILYNGGPAVYSSNMYYEVLIDELSVEYSHELSLKHQIPQKIDCHLQQFILDLDNAITL
jgi:hypothetical protein